MYGFISARRLETALQRRVHVPAHTLYAASMSGVTPSGIDESSVLQRKPRVIAKLLAAHQTESVYSNSSITRSRGSGVVIICLTICFRPVTVCIWGKPSIFADVDARNPSSVSFIFFRYHFLYLSASSFCLEKNLDVSLILCVILS